MTSPLIDPVDLKTQLTNPNLVVVDLRWYNTGPGSAQAAFLSGHIPGAILLDLDTDCADCTDVRRGRHPLPDPELFVASLTRVGIGRNSTVVIYDDAAGSIAARLWWMLRWLGHENAAVLNGGLACWIAKGYPLESGPSTAAPSDDPLSPIPRSDMLVELPFMQSADRYRCLLLDARAPERFRGEIEPIDFRAGHIPGAINAPWSDNLVSAENPIFKSAVDLRRRFEALGVSEETEVVCSCGSGVTACHNILALELAGFTKVRLYAGSWSEWIHHT